MIFSSLTFLFAFLPAVLVIYFLAPKKFKNCILLIFSLFFYAFGEPTYVLIMLGSITLNYIFGILISKYENIKTKKYLLISSVASNLLILVFFKYLVFLITNINILFSSNLTVPEISLPLGISFFTFQAMSYTVDVFRNDAKVQKNIFNLALYISLFPQLVAGPIVRYQTVADEIDDRTTTLNDFSYGVHRFVIGLSKKVILANNLGLLSDKFFNIEIVNLTILGSWIGIIAFSLQIFFDFAGYSDMAIGLGKMFGFNFLENFNYPYISTSVSEFWRRWHMSLGSFFRDYVYIPLGGNKVSKVKFYRNIFIVWFLTGLWHGASWTFIAWGLYFGLFITLEKVFILKLLNKLPKFTRHIYLLFVVIIGWVFFRADNFELSINYLQTMFGGNLGVLTNLDTAIIFKDFFEVLILGIILATPIVPYTINKIKTLKPNIITKDYYHAFHGLSLAIMTLTVIERLLVSSYNPFLYFRF